MKQILTTVTLVLAFLMVMNAAGQNVNIPDPAFKAYLVGRLDINTNGDGEIQVSEAEAFIGTEINGINVSNLGIHDLTGIEAFINLLNLDCSTNVLYDLDLSHNTALIRLGCYENRLSSLNFSNNTSLTHINAFNNNLTSIDISHNPVLDSLEISENNLTTLDVSNNTQLFMLDCDQNHLTSLDVSHNLNLSNLSCTYNYLTHIDVSNNPTLTYFTCFNNLLTDIDLSHNPALTYFICWNNYISSIDASHNSALTFFDCFNNSVIYLNIANGNNAALNSTFYANGNPYLTCIQVDNVAWATAHWLASVNIDNAASFSLFCPTPDIVYFQDSIFKAALVSDTTINTNHNNEIEVYEAAAYHGAINVSLLGIQDMIGIEAFTGITELYCYDNSLNTLDVSHNTALTVLVCNHNNFNSLDVTQNTSLQTLDCSYNSIVHLDVSQNSNLVGLQCNGNSLVGLDVSHNSALGYLYCYSNPLFFLDVSHNTALNILGCSDNSLGVLDVSNNAGLSKLYCDYNNLTDIDISHNSALITFDCTHNSIFHLDVSVNTTLSNFYCSGNPVLNTLNIANGHNTDFSAFDASNNPDLTCIKVDDVAYATTTWTVGNGSIDSGASFSLNCACTAILNIPDANFKAALLANPAINTNGDNEIQVCEADAFTGTIDVNGLSIAQLAGIQNFPNITGLLCGGNTISTVDLSYNHALVYLYCDHNNFSSLDVSHNPALTTINCYNNMLTSIDVSNNPALTTLNCNYNSITNLDMSHNTSLTNLQCTNNALTNLTVANGNNTNMTTFSAINNAALSCISVDDTIWANANWTVSNFNIDASATFSLNCNCIVVVNIPDAIFKAYLVGRTDINTNGDGEIQVCEANAFAGDIQVDSRGIFDLTGIEAFPNIVMLDCYDNFILSLDLSHNTALTDLNCGRNILTTLDVSHNTALQYLRCYGNSMTTLDVTNNTALILFSTANNNLNSLNVANGNNTNITLFDATLNPNLSCITVDDIFYSSANWTVGNGSIDATASFSLNCAACAPIVNIPDANLKAYLLANTAINTNGDNEIQVCEATAFADYIYVPSLGITDLTGIEAFTGLATLYCYSNPIGSLDFSHNIALNTVYCSNNSLNSLNLMNCTALTYLECSSNSLTNIDFSQNTALTYIYCYDNMLSSLDVSNNAALQALVTYNNSLTMLDVSHNPLLNNFDCSFNTLTSLNLANGNNTNLEFFNAVNNPNLFCVQVDDVDYSTNYWIDNVDANAHFSLNCNCSDIVNIPNAAFKTALLADTAINTNGDGEIQFCEAEAFHGTMDVSHLFISSLTGIEAFTSLTGLICFNNYLNSFDISHNIALTYLDCSQNQISNLDVSNNTSLAELHCADDMLDNLDVTHNTALITLYCNNNIYSNYNNLISLDMSHNTALTYLDCSGNNSLSSLDVSHCTALTDLYCWNDLLTSINVTNNPALNTLYCYDNTVLSSLDLSHNIALTDLVCYDNSLNNLDVSHNTALLYLQCAYNNLTSLDVSLNTSLIELTPANNFINSLDVSNNTALTVLECNHNNISSLDVSHNPELIYFFCPYNDLHNLNVANGHNHNITTAHFWASHNPNLSCIQVDDIVYSTANWTVVSGDIDASESFSLNCTPCANPPTPIITSNGNTTFCDGGNVTLDAGTFTSYSWSNGATTQTITVASSGICGVTVTDANTCTGTASITVSINPNPTPVITSIGSTTFCDGGSVMLDAGTFISYSWSNGATTQTIITTIGGIYIVTVTNANTCTGTASIAVAVNPNPIPTIMGLTSTCAGTPVSLDAGSWISYLWSTSETIQLITTATGGAIQVTVTDGNGCTGVASTYVTINALPTPSIAPNGPTTFCDGGSVSLDAGSYASYLWNDGSSAETITAFGTQPYCVTVTDVNGCSGTTCLSVTVYSNLTAIITPNGPTAFCAGGSVALTASGGTAYSWSDGASTATINASASGTYSVTVSNGQGCSASASTTVTVYQNPIPTIIPNGPTTFCQGGSVLLNAGAYSSYLWSNGAITQSITVVASNPYRVTVTNAHGCTAAAAQINITVTPTITGLAIVGATTTCTGGNSSLSTNNTYSAYLWSNGATTQSITISATGIYYVTVSNGGNCSAAAHQSVTVLTAPIPNIISANLANICGGGNASLTASPVFAAYLWNTNATSQGIIINTGGSYSVTVTSVNGCTGMASTLIPGACNFPTFPVNATTNIAATTAMANWIQPTCYYGYTIRISKHNATIWSTHTISPNTHYTFSQLTHNTAYDWQIQANCNASGTVNSGFSAAQTFTTAPRMEEGDVASLATFNIYPNPAKDHLTIVFSSDKEQAYTLRLIDVMGRIMMNQNHTSVVGDNQIELNLSEIPKGLYLVLMQNEDGVMQRKVVVE